MPYFGLCQYSDGSEINTVKCDVWTVGLPPFLMIVPASLNCCKQNEQL